MIMNKFPKKGVPSSGKGGWVDPTRDKVLNSTRTFSLRQGDLIGGSCMSVCLYVCMYVCLSVIVL